MFCVFLHAVIRARERLAKSKENKCAKNDLFIRSADFILVGIFLSLVSNMLGLNADRIRLLVNSEMDDGNSLD